MSIAQSAFIPGTHQPGLYGRPGVRESDAATLATVDCQSGDGDCLFPGCRCASMPHRAQRSYGVSVWALKAGDILQRDGHEYRVNEGFDRDSSSCWRDSRWVQCTQLTGEAFKGAMQYVNPTGAVVK